MNWTSFILGMLSCLFGSIALGIVIGIIILKLEPPQRMDE